MSTVADQQEQRVATPSMNNHLVKQHIVAERQDRGVATLDSADGLLLLLGFVQPAACLNGSSEPQSGRVHDDSQEQGIQVVGIYLQADQRPDAWTSKGWRHWFLPFAPPCTLPMSHPFAAPSWPALTSFR